MAKVEKWEFMGRREATLFPTFGVTESFAHTDSVLEIQFRHKHARYVDYEWWCKTREFLTLKNLLEKYVEAEPAHIEYIYEKQISRRRSLTNFFKEISCRQRPTKMVRTRNPTIPIRMVIQEFPFSWQQFLKRSRCHGSAK